MSITFRSPTNACVVGLAATLALALGMRPAAAAWQHRVEHPVQQKELQHASKEPFGDIPKGPVQIVVSIDQQKLHLYSDGSHVADTSIATGVPSLPTPLGMFSVIQKQVFHRSNIYSNAPMPFMQRITWSGVALHEGENIGHPASHGCIRMPREFAVRLYRLTRLGVPVIIARPELKPAPFADPHLFVHRDAPPAVTPAPAAPVAAAPGATPTVGSTADAAPASATIAAATDAAPASSVAAAPASATPAVAPGIAADPPKADVIGLRVSDQEIKPSRATDAASADTLPAASGASVEVPLPPAQPEPLLRVLPSSKAPIAVFISRKTKKIYVRQDFAPLFDAAVTIADPGKPIGTHLFTALGFAGDDHRTLRWNVVSYPGETVVRKVEEQRRFDRNAKTRRREERHERSVTAPPPETPAAALDRIEIPQNAIDIISQLIVPGSTLTISDQGLGDETGEGTNFVVVMK